MYRFLLDFLTLVAFLVAGGCFVLVLYVITSSMQ